MGSTKVLGFLLCAAVAHSLPRSRNQRNKFQFYELPNQHVPKSIEIYYDKLMSFPGNPKYGQNLTLINETVTEDWNTGPNPINPGFGIETGPFPQGLKALLELKSKMFRNIRVKRNETYVIGNKVVVLCRVKATMNEVPAGYPGYPMFPGIEAKKLKGKSFESMKIDVHVMDNVWDGHKWCQKIRRSWHFEDWTLALDEMLTGRRPFKFQHPYVRPDRNLTEVPRSIDNFYKKILSDVSVGGKNTTLLEETVHDDWSSRPNYINLVDGKGPGLNGLKGLTGLFAQIMPELKFTRKYVWLHADKVIVLSKVTAKITAAPRGSNEIPLFPGIPAEKLMGKEFTTVALDIHKIVDGKIKQSYHIEDWHTALEQMLYNKDPPCFGLYPDYTNFHVPKVVKTFYDHIWANPGTYGQNMTLINETVTRDWNSRPNPFDSSKGVQAGPFPHGLKKMLGMWHTMMPDLFIERMATMRLGRSNKVAVISRFGATLNELPEGWNEYPMFPGIPVEKLKGKNFSTLALDVQVLDEDEHHYPHQHPHQYEEKIRRSWHAEDWTQAAEQMLKGRKPRKLAHEWHQRGKNLTAVPKSLYNFYDRILSNPEQARQNFKLLNETLQEDWSLRPNPLEYDRIEGPGISGLQNILQMLSRFIPDLKFERQEMFLHEDKVIVLLKVSGTIDSAGQDEIDIFPGVPAEKLNGKKFETMALDMHCIFDGKMQKSYHIEDWRTALYQMLKDEPVPDFGFDREYIQFERFNLTEQQSHRVPRAIENLYDKLANHPETYGQNQTLINQTFTEDFNMRPNPLNPQRGLQAGPLRTGLKSYFSLKHVMFRDINVTRMYTVQFGNLVLVVGNCSATMNYIPPGLPGYPMFPGIPEKKLRNKHFSTLSMDLHVLDNDKIRRTWHFEDDRLALDQMLYGRHRPNLTHPYIPRGKVLEKVPQSIYNLYDKLTNNAVDEWQNDALIEETFTEDYTWRPKDGHHDEMETPQDGRDTVKEIFKWFAQTMPDVKSERKATLLFEDSVIVLSHLHGTISERAPREEKGRTFGENALFPGIQLDKIAGKRFETMELAVFCIRDGKIAQSYHITDWTTALHQMLMGTPAPDFGFERSFVDF